MATAHAHPEGAAGHTPEHGKTAPAAEVSAAHAAERPGVGVEAGADERVRMDVKQAFNTSGFTTFIKEQYPGGIAGFDSSDTNVDEITEWFRHFEQDKKVKAIVKKPGFGHFLEVYRGDGPAVATSFDNAEQIESLFGLFERAKKTARDLRAAFIDKLIREKSGKLTPEDIKGFDTYVYGEAAAGNLETLETEVAVFKALPAKIAEAERTLKELQPRPTTPEERKRVAEELARNQEKSALLKEVAQDFPEEGFMNKLRRGMLGGFVARRLGGGTDTDLETRLSALPADGLGMTEKQRDEKSRLRKELERRKAVDAANEAEPKAMAARYRLVSEFDVPEADVYEKAKTQTLLGAVDEEIKKAEELLLSPEKRAEAQERAKKGMELLHEMRSRVFGQIPVVQEIRKRISTQLATEMQQVLTSKHLTVVERFTDKFKHFEALAASEDETANYFTVEGAELPLPREEFREALNEKMELLVAEGILTDIKRLPPGATERRLESLMRRYITLAKKGLGLSDDSEGKLIEILRAQEQKLIEENNEAAILVRRLISRLENPEAPATVPAVETTPTSASSAAKASAPSSAASAEKPVSSSTERAERKAAPERWERFAVGDKVMWFDRYTGEPKWPSPRVIRSFTGTGRNRFAVFAEPVSDTPGEKVTSVRVDVLEDEAFFIQRQKKGPERTAPFSAPERTEVAGALQLLSYPDVAGGDARERLRLTGESEGGKRYAEELAGLIKKYGQAFLFGMADQMQRDVTASLNRFGIPISPFGKSRSWALWDIAKQEYFANHPSEVRPPYTAGSVFSSSPHYLTEKYDEIVNRHLGWETYSAYRGGAFQELAVLDKLKPEHRGEVTALLKKPPKDNGTLASHELARLGALLREGPSSTPPPPPREGGGPVTGGTGPGETPPPPEGASEKGSSESVSAKKSEATVPVMITKKMEQDLSGMGLTREQINKLTPEQAWQVLSGKETKETEQEKATGGPAKEGSKEAATSEQVSPEEVAAVGEELSRLFVSSLEVFQKTLNTAPMEVVVTAFHPLSTEQASSDAIENIRSWLSDENKASFDRLQGRSFVYTDTTIVKARKRLAGIGKEVEASSVAQPPANDAQKEAEANETGETKKSEQGSESKAVNKEKFEACEALQNLRPPMQFFKNLVPAYSASIAAESSAEKQKAFDLKVLDAERALREALPEMPEYLSHLAEAYERALDEVHTKGDISEANYTTYRDFVPKAARTLASRAVQPDTDIVEFVRAFEMLKRFKEYTIYPDIDTKKLHFASLSASHEKERLEQSGLFKEESETAKTETQGGIKGTLAAENLDRLTFNDIFNLNDGELRLIVLSSRKTDLGWGLLMNGMPDSDVQRVRSALESSRRPGYEYSLSEFDEAVRRPQSAEEKEHTRRSREEFLDSYERETLAELLKKYNESSKA